MNSQAIQKTGSKLFSKGFGKFFSFLFVFIFLIIPVLYSVVISIEAESAEPGIKYLGNKFLEPTITIQEESLKIIDQEGIYSSSENYFAKAWTFIKTYWSLLGALYIIYRWLWLFTKIISVSPLSNNSETFRNWFMASIAFIGLQFIYLLGTAPTDVNCWNYSMSVFTVWGDFFKACPYLIKQANSFIDPSINLNATNITI